MPFSKVILCGNLHFELHVRERGSVFWVVQYRYGTGAGGLGALVIPLVAAFCCGALSVASNSRCAALGPYDHHGSHACMPGCMHACIQVLQFIFIHMPAQVAIQSTTGA